MSREPCHWPLNILQLAADGQRDKATGPRKPWVNSVQFRPHVGREYSSLTVIAAECNTATLWITSLRALELASDIYSQLPRSTVSLRIVEQDLSKARWLPRSLQRIIAGGNRGDLRSFVEALETPLDDYLDDMTLEDSLACIAMFESDASTSRPRSSAEWLLCAPRTPSSYPNSYFPIRLAVRLRLPFGIWWATPGKPAWSSWCHRVNPRSGEPPTIPAWSSIDLTMGSA